MGILTLPNTWFPGPKRVTPQMVSQSVQSFLHRHIQTDTQITVCATSVATGHIYAQRTDNVT